MTHIPLNLALRDLDIEQNNGISNDNHAYQSVRDLMMSFITIVECAGTETKLDMYFRIFRHRTDEVVFQSENFLIQYDGLRKTLEDDDQWRLIWRDIVIGWYKHPLRGLEANREPSAAEKALMQKEFTQDFTRYIENLSEEERKDNSLRIPLTRESIARINQKLMNNAVSGAHLKTPVQQAQILDLLGFEPKPHQLPMLDQLASLSSRLKSKGMHITQEQLGEMEEAARVNPTFATMLAEMKENPGIKIIAEIDSLAEFETSTRKPHRMTQGQYGDYAAAAAQSPRLTAMWERMKQDPGIEIIPESERDPHGIGDLSVMFMYPHEITPLDLSKISGVTHKDITPTDVMLNGIELHGREYDPRTNQLALAIIRGKTRSDSAVSNRQYTYDTESRPWDTDPIVDERPASVGTAPSFFISNGRIRPKHLADLVRFSLFAMYHPLLNPKG